MKTRFTEQTGIEIRRSHENRWRHVEVARGKEAYVGPDYHTKQELLRDHEAYLRRAGWLRD